MHLRAAITTATVLFLFLYPHKNVDHTNMGMSYYIVPNKKTSCKDNFGNGLSFFFEQVGGYGEKAEVAQVSQVLNIDLSIFQDVGYDPEDEAEVKKHWHNLDSFASVVHTFIGKINSQPDYYKQILHNPNWKKNLEEQERLWRMTDTAERDKQLEKLQNEPLYYYPPDYGYLSEGRLLKDLQILKRTLECYKRNGVTRIRLEYV